MIFQFSSCSMLPLFQLFVLSKKIKIPLDPPGLSVMQVMVTKLESINHWSCFSVSVMMPYEWNKENEAKLPWYNPLRITLYCIYIFVSPSFIGYRDSSPSTVSTAGAPRAETDELRSGEKLRAEGVWIRGTCEWNLEADTQTPFNNQKHWLNHCVSRSRGCRRNFSVCKMRETLYKLPAFRVLQRKWRSCTQL